MIENEIIDLATTNLEIAIAEWIRVHGHIEYEVLTGDGYKITITPIKPS